MKVINEDRAACKRVWQRLRADPTFRPTGFLQNRAILYSVIGESKRRAKESRAAKVKGVSRRSPIVDPTIQRHLQPDIDRLDPLEAEWRLEAGAIWWNAAHRQDDQMKSLSDWLIHMVRLEPHGLEEWMRFWLNEVDGSAVNITRVQMLAGLFQANLRVDAGLSGDVLHTAQAAQCDVILTADRGLFNVLMRVAGVPGVLMAKPFFIDRQGVDIATEISAAIGW